MNLQNVSVCNSTMFNSLSFFEVCFVSGLPFSDTYRLLRLCLKPVRLIIISNNSQSNHTKSWNMIDEKATKCVNINSIDKWTWWKKIVKNKRNGVTNFFVIMFNKVICKSFKFICKQMDNYLGMWKLLWTVPFDTLIFLLLVLDLILE